MSEAILSSQFPTADTLSGMRVLATDSEGNIKRVALSPFAVRQHVSGTTDLNNYKTSGLWSFGVTQKNQPVNMAGCLMWVWSHSEGYVFQLVTGMMWDAGLYYRRISPSMNDWSTWKSISGVAT